MNALTCVFAVLTGVVFVGGIANLIRLTIAECRRRNSSNL